MTELYLPYNIERRFHNFCKINRISESEGLSFIVMDYFKFIDENPSIARVVNRDKLKANSDFGDIKKLWWGDIFMTERKILNVDGITKAIFLSFQVVNNISEQEAIEFIVADYFKKLEINAKILSTNGIIKDDIDIEKLKISKFKKPSKLEKLW